MLSVILGVVRLSGAIVILQHPVSQSLSEMRAGAGLAIFIVTKQRNYGVESILF